MAEIAKKEKFNKVVVLDSDLTNPARLDFVNMLRGVAEQVVIYDSTTPREAKRRCRGADAIVIGKRSIDSDTLRSLSRQLKLVVAASCGHDYIDDCLDTAKELGIKVCNVPDYCSDAVAGYIFRMLQKLCSEDGLESGWRNAGQEIMRQAPLAMRELTIGIIGLGRIGTKVAALANDNRMKRVIAYSPHWQEKKLPDGIRVEFVEGVAEVVSRSDVITLHCALTKDTRKLIDESMIYKMKHGAVLINTSRSEIIDEEALLSNFLNTRHRRIRTAILDVAGRDSKLSALRGVVITDHKAYATTTSFMNLLEGVVANCESYLNNTPINIVEGYPSCDFGLLSRQANDGRMLVSGDSNRGRHIVVTQNSTLAVANMM